MGFQAIFTLLLLYFSQQNHALHMPRPPEHIHGLTFHNAVAFLLKNCKSLARLSGPQEMYTTFEGAILHTELMNFKELPLRGGSIKTTSYLRPEAASFSICSPASPAMNFTFFKLLSLQFVRASFTASRLSSTPVTDKALSEAQMPIVPIPLYASKHFPFR